MLGDKPELGQLRKIAYIACPDTSKRVFLLSALKAAELVVQVGDERLGNVRHVFTESNNESSI